MNKSIPHPWWRYRGCAAVFLLGLGLSGNALASFDIDSARWSNDRDRVTVIGSCDGSRTITVTNADSGASVGSDQCDDGSWRVSQSYSNNNQVPCRVRAVQSNGESDERNVSNAPSNCDDGGGATTTTSTTTVTTSTTTTGGGTTTTTTQPPPPDIGLDNPQTDYKIMMNYELGMHCTGFEFAYCCVLPVYNSILAQVVKPAETGGFSSSENNSFPELLEGDPAVGLDPMGRQTVVREKALDGSGNFKKFMLRYWHDAQPRNDGRGKSQFSTLISAAEGNSLFAWNTSFDSAHVLADGSLDTAGSYNGADPGTVIRGDGILGQPADNYQNAVWNHFYIYKDLEGTVPGECTLPAIPGELGKSCTENGDCGESAPGAGDGTGTCDTTVKTTRESNKIRLGVNGHIVYPTDCGAGLHPLGPVTQNGDPDNPVVANTCDGNSNGNVLTFSGDTGTVVYTQMKVLENLPVMLTSPEIWEALGLPLTPFEDTIDFFSDPGLVDEDSIRPYVAMKAQLLNYPSETPVLDGSGNPVIGFGTAPIDIPNCERCHSNPPNGYDIPNSEAESAFPGEILTVVNSPNGKHIGQWAMVQAEYSFWNAYYGINTGAPDYDSDWYSRLKSAAISMLFGHDAEHATSFTTGGDGPGGSEPDYPVCGGGLDLDVYDPLDPSTFVFDASTIDVGDCDAPPQNTRLGHEAVICQRCHADNVIAVVKSATHNGGDVIMPITEAIHNNHAGNDFADSEGRSGGCQGCHPAHRSSGVMAGYPITLAGANLYATADNRDANGGCFVGRDVHSNPVKDTDGAETPEHLNAVGQWLSATVFSDQGPDGDKGIWCTNCHSQLGQEMWKQENVYNLVKGLGVCVDATTGTVGDPVETCKVDGDCGGGESCALNNIRNGSLTDIANAVVGGDPVTALNKLYSWADPKLAAMSYDGVDHTHDIWAPLPQPALCAFLADPDNPANDGNVATVEVAIPSKGHTCSTGEFMDPVDCTAEVGFTYNICGKFDDDNNFSANILDFCTTSDCVDAAQDGLTNSAAVAVPFSAATDGRDHWLAGGEPHCADCHAAPYVEQSGNINAYPPFNYPRKAGLMRYSKGHQGITCQGCHESIHGLYPVTPSIDTTSYAQAAALNDDGSHGPLKCGTCHTVGSNDIPTWVDELRYTDPVTGTVTQINGNFDRAVSWMHTFTAEADPRQDVCRNCHGDETDEVSWNNDEWTEHAMRGRTSRQTMDTVEALEGINMSNPRDTLCRSCHGDEWGEVSCGEREWKEHLTEGRVSEQVWVDVTMQRTGGSTCGW